MPPGAIKLSRSSQARAFAARFKFLNDKGQKLPDDIPGIASTEVAFHSCIYCKGQFDGNAWLLAPAHCSPPRLFLMMERVAHGSCCAVEILAVDEFCIAMLRGSGARACSIVDLITKWKNSKRKQ